MGMRLCYTQKHCLVLVGYSDSCFPKTKKLLDKYHYDKKEYHSRGDRFSAEFFPRFMKRRCMAFYRGEGSQIVGSFTKVEIEAMDDKMAHILYLKHVKKSPRYKRKYN
jgi:hypothetical protein